MKHKPKVGSIWTLSPDKEYFPGAYRVVSYIEDTSHIYDKQTVYYKVFQSNGSLIVYGFATLEKWFDVFIPYELN